MKTALAMFLRLTQIERRELEGLAREADSGRMKIRAQALLEIDAGSRPHAVAQRYGVARSTVYNWIKRGTACGFTREALRDRPRPGRPRQEFPRNENSVAQTDSASDRTNLKHLG